MHPYEMATTMRQRGKHESIKLNYGSLYNVVQSLERAGLIESQETEREGRRPERTVYRLLDAGRVELIDWLSEMLSTPAKEFTQFEAGLSLLPCLPPEDVLGAARGAASTRPRTRSSPSAASSITPTRSGPARASSRSRASTASRMREAELAFVHAARRRDPLGHASAASSCGGGTTMQKPPQLPPGDERERRTHEWRLGAAPARPRSRRSS